MDRNQQNERDDKQPVISPLANDTTYGEQRFHRIFNVGINFWVNLIASAAFTYWASHSKTPFKIPFIGKESLSPLQRQEHLAEGLHKLPFMKAFGEKLSEKRLSAARTMANVLTLLTAGHFIMIPGVYIGAKLKPKLVEKWDRAHYGDEAMEDPSIKLRHAAVAAEERPTFFGSVMGRVGTVFATQATAYTIGNRNNIPSKLGEKFAALRWFKGLRGIDYFTEMLGSKLGSAFTEIFPNAVAKLNRTLAKKGYGWSSSQLELHPELKNQVYGTVDKIKDIGGGAPEHFGRFLIADITYTVVTACTIKPAINFFKRFIPGMTYKPKITAGQKRTLDSANGINIEVSSRHPLLDMPAQAANDEQFSEKERTLGKAGTESDLAANDAAYENATPHTKINHIHAHSKVTSHQQKHA